MTELKPTADLLQRLGPKERRGSKPRCHLLTHCDRHEVARRLTSLVHPWGEVASTDRWMPNGFINTEEAQLDKAERLIPSQDDRNILKTWWLADPRPTSTTPCWDIASTCSICGRNGSLLVEAKAHHAELANGGKPLGKNNSKANHERIGSAIAEANDGLTVATKSEWHLSHTRYYQMSNRFAWSWKLCTLGYPVVLIYLGFLGADEMVSSFADDLQWDRIVKEHSAPLFASDMWGRMISIGRVAFLPLIRKSPQSLRV
jgi:hypothetical protein